MNNNNDDLFNEANIPTANWFKFDKVGDKIGGVVVRVFRKEAQGQFGAQLAYTLREASGITNGEAVKYDEVNVGVKDNDYFRPRLQYVKIGDKVGFEFKEEIPAKVKGNSPAKSIQPFHKKMDDEFKKEFAKRHEDISEQISYDVNIGGIDQF